MYRFASLLTLTVSLVVYGADGAGTPKVNFYVSPSGDDAAVGTDSAPFQTLSQAQDAVRALPAESRLNVTVELGDGTYALTEPLLFGPEDSGLVFRAAEGARPVVSGGVAVTGWESDENGRWKAQTDIVACRQFYVDGVRAQRARGAFPEGAERFGELKAIDEEAGFRMPDGSLADWKRPEDLELGFYNSWSHMIGRVASVRRNGEGVAELVMQQPGFYLLCRKEGVKAEYPAYMENALELLDEPGEWYHDPETRVIYYLQREGEDLLTADCVVPLLETLVSLRGTVDAPVRNIRFEGITFADATWLGPNRIGHADVQANFSIEPTNLFERDGSLVNLHNEYVKSPANVTVEYGHGIVFEDCTFTRLGGAGLDLGRGSQECVVSRCTFADISGSGIQIGDVQQDDHHPANPAMVVHGIRVADCLVERMGAEYEDSVGIFAGYVQETVIEHNEIRDLPYSGISVGWGWGEEDSGGGNYPIPFVYEQPTPARDNRIANNHIYRVMQRRNDGGGVYMLGNQPGTVISGNYIHDNPGWPGGIYLDEGSGFIEITGNVVHGAETPMNYNNRAQNRIETCNEHDNHFGVAPGEAGFPEAIAEAAGRR
jgi:hypothetical protein